MLLDAHFGRKFGLRIFCWTILSRIVQFLVQIQKPSQPSFHWTKSWTILKQVDQQKNCVLASSLKSQQSNEQSNHHNQIVALASSRAMRTGTTILSVDSSDSNSNSNSTTSTAELVRQMTEGTVTATQTATSTATIKTNNREDSKEHEPSNNNRGQLFSSSAACNHQAIRQCGC